MVLDNAVPIAILKTFIDCLHTVKRCAGTNLILYVPDLFFIFIVSLFVYLFNRQTQLTRGVPRKSSSENM